MNKAIEAGATVVSPAQSFDYGYRQAEIKDPFGHCWLIEMRLKAIKKINKIHKQRACCDQYADHYICLSFLFDSYPRND